MRIFITGVTGYLGRNLTLHLSRANEVIGLSRKEETLPGVSTVRLELGERVSASLFHGCNTVIHTAHDFAAGAEEKNIWGTSLIRDAAAEAGVAQQIFLTSYSARPDAKSEYGRTKYRIEKAFLDMGLTVLRLGLVIGNGGLFACMRRSILRTPIVPLIGAGKDRVALIAVSHVLAATETIISRRLIGAYGLFYEVRPTTQEFVQAIKLHAGQRPRFLSIPTELAIAALSVARLLKLPIGLHAEQVRSLRLNESAPWASDLCTLLPAEREHFQLAYALHALAASL
jgi:nucleoside-diphosphate-sugar epimerase